MCGLRCRCQNENKMDKVGIPLKNENLATRNKPTIEYTAMKRWPSLFVLCSEYDQWLSLLQPTALMHTARPSVAIIVRTPIKAEKDIVHMNFNED